MVSTSARRVRHAGKPVRAGVDGSLRRQTARLDGQTRASRGGWRIEEVKGFARTANPCEQGWMDQDDFDERREAGKPVRAGVDGHAQQFGMTCVRQTRASRDGW